MKSKRIKFGEKWWIWKELQEGGVYIIKIHIFMYEISNNKC